ncbi:MAG: DUF3098 domain-containing protein [Haliscomenobacter sp.]|nr:DUF3098 domain-containing protein [Haliscomenobacter sp.]MBK8655551.1 DUF3098 domain-containing protein [Haliscomenobacter sp.]MBP9075555.1 DUF3098 domain-containing protein [Haliscomenobacter sp.]MBP9873635.1 DUF3098 domain-containing protein [Haliscomenobacter sp.]
MSKQQGPKKKVVAAAPKAAKQPPVVAAKPKTGRPSLAEKKVELIFNRNNYILMGAGALLMAIGILLMGGGDMPDPNTWDESIIYSPRRMVLAPIFMIAGLVVEVFAIFKR